MKKSVLRRIAMALLVLLMALEPMMAMAEEAAQAEQEVTHIATASLALKVRRRPEKESGGSDSIPKDALVYILELGDEWCKVETSYTVGYVMTQYLTDIREYSPLTGSMGAAVAAQEPDGQPVQGFTTTKETFVEGYYAHAAKAAAIYQEPDERSRRIDNVPIYDQVVVSEIQQDWAFVRYGGTYGYIRTNALFKWDRIDPYIGDIPGLDVWPYLAFVNHTTNIYSMDDNSVVKTINPGAAVCVGEKDELGRYPLPYWRTTGYISEEDIAYLMPVVDYANAESGDLLSVMTTYFAVGKTTLNYQGRNWNIRLSSSMISGTVLQPGEEYNQNEVIGPYRKSTGYKSAPIMSKKALTGYGGGTCQVNTTFYITTVQLPLLVKHRRVHAEVGIYYAKVGFDAAVGSGSINLIMENTLPYAIRYQCFISDGVCTVCIFRA